VIEGGQITEIGTHEELMQHSGTYQRLYRMQFSVEDSAPVGPGEVALTANLEGIA
jgi:subfamily B ATP-binding cassette protein MsbA